MGHLVKSCGKAHPHCRKCRPDVAKKIRLFNKLSPNRAMLGRTHSLKTREKMRVAALGRTHTPETRAKLADASRKHTGWHHSSETRKKQAEATARYISQYPSPKTSLEYALARLLTKAGFEFEEQKKFGRCVVDAYDPENGLVWEADGTYWHQDKNHEIKRDNYLLSQGVAAVIHLTEEDLTN